MFEQKLQEKKRQAKLEGNEEIKKWKLLKEMMQQTNDLRWDQILNKMREKEMLKSYIDKVWDEHIAEKRELQYCKSVAIRIKNEKEERKRAY